MYTVFQLIAMEVKIKNNNIALLGLNDLFLKLVRVSFILYHISTLLLPYTVQSFKQYLLNKRCFLNNNVL